MHAWAFYEIHMNVSVPLALKGYSDLLFFENAIED
jgi:hypothetical protein